MKTRRAIFLLVPFLAASYPALAQKQPAEPAQPAMTEDKPADDMQIIREKLAADKKLLVSDNMKLTESEAKAFWPVYDAYQKDLEAINQRLKKTVETYAKAYNADSVTDGIAKGLISDYMSIEEDEVKLKKTYVPKLFAVLPATKVARYLQIETKIRALMRFDMSRSIPLI